MNYSNSKRLFANLITYVFQFVSMSQFRQNVAT